MVILFQRGVYLVKVSYKGLKEYFSLRQVFGRKRIRRPIYVFFGMSQGKQDQEESPVFHLILIQFNLIMEQDQA